MNFHRLKFVTKTRIETARMWLKSQSNTNFVTKN